jgi:hypothetical protein
MGERPYKAGRSNKGPIPRPRVIVHVDMDAFYASVEQLDFPEYRGRPVVVGADPCGGRGRGVVSAASYEARKYGIHSAQPISHAYRSCPSAVFLRPRFHRYMELSGMVMSILSGFSPLVEQISIDEAFLDCTGTTGIFGSEKQIAAEIKARIKEKTGLTASVGIATNKSVAKIASELCKPDGLLICPAGGEKEFLKKLTLSHLWGAGKKTIERLGRMGFLTIGDIASQRRYRRAGGSALPAEEVHKRRDDLWKRYRRQGVYRRGAFPGRRQADEKDEETRDFRPYRYPEDTVRRLCDFHALKDPPARGERHADHSRRGGRPLFGLL